MDLRSLPWAAVQHTVCAFGEPPQQPIQPAPHKANLSNPACTAQTLMARAVAGESGVAFISSSASEFIEMYMGLGAARVRDLFNTVRACWSGGHCACFGMKVG